MNERYWIPTTIEWKYLKQILDKIKKSEFKGASKFWEKRLKPRIGKHDGDIGISFVNPKVCKDYPEKSYKFDVLEIKKIHCEPGEKFNIAGKEYDSYYDIKLGKQLKEGEQND